MNLRHEIPPIVIKVPADTWNQSLNSSQMETEDIIYCQLNNESPTNNSTQNAANDHVIRNNEADNCSEYRRTIDAEFEDNRHGDKNSIHTETCPTDSAAMMSQGAMISEASKPRQQLSSLQKSVPKETSNKSKSERATTLSEFLKLPPTPRRSTKHRNYSKQYYPVLTAKERLDEMRKKEDEKRVNENLKVQRS